MEQSTLFTTSKWDVLQVLSRGEASPIELAKEAKTSIANISQQLRLLELAGFVKSRRIPNRDKGKPRIVYSLTDEFAFIVVAAAGFVDKRFIKLNQLQKATLRCWFHPDAASSQYLEQAVRMLFPANPKLIAFDPSSSCLYVINDSAKDAGKGKDAEKDKLRVDVAGMPSRQFSVKYLKDEALAKTAHDSWQSLHDPNNLLSKQREVGA